MPMHRAFCPGDCGLFPIGYLTFAFTTTPFIGLGENFVAFLVSLCVEVYKEQMPVLISLLLNFCGIFSQYRAKHEIFCS